MRLIRQIVRLLQLGKNLGLQVISRDSIACLVPTIAVLVDVVVDLVDDPDVVVSDIGASIAILALASSSLQIIHGLKVSHVLSTCLAKASLVIGISVGVRG